MGAFLLSAPIIFGQEASPTPQTPDRSGVTIEEVVVTGSNIPTSEEVGPNPVDTYRREDITRLGVHSATELIQKLPAATGAAINENKINGGDGRPREINLRGILAKETLVLQDGRRLAPVGFAGDTVDLNTIPLGLIDHIDILKDGASSIYGADAVDGVVNVFSSTNSAGSSSTPAMAAPILVLPTTWVKKGHTSSPALGTTRLTL